MPDVLKKPLGPEVGRSKFRLGAVEVRPRSGLVSGPGGERKLDPKVLAVLLQLVAADGHVVSRADLMARVWDGVIVTDFALSRCIYQLRKTLSEAAESDDSPIETLPKRGYRLLWPVHPGRGQAPPARTAPRRVRAGFMAAAVVVVAAATSLLTEVMHERAQGPDDANERVVVIPLEDQSDDASLRVFANGLTGEIRHELGRIDGLAVVGSRSARRNDFESVPPREFAQRLSADFLVGGSVKLIGDTRRVLVYMERVGDGAQLWSHAFMVEPDAPFTVVANVVEMTVARLEFAIMPDRQPGSSRNLEAFEAYLASFESNSYEKRKRLLERAVTIDPEFALAWDRLAGIEVLPVWNGETTVEAAWDRARPSVERALEIDPELANAHVTLGRFQREFGDLDAAAEHFRRALVLEPGNVWASANLGLVLRFTGQYQEALAVHLEDVRDDPLSAPVQARLGTSNWFVENHDEAERRYLMAVELDPDFEETYDSWAAMEALGRGRLDRAMEVIKRKIAVEPNPTARTYGAAAAWSRALGMNEEAARFGQLAGDGAGRSPDACLADGDLEAARQAALATLEASPRDTLALLVLAALEKRLGTDLEFSGRVFSSFPDIAEQKLHPHTPYLEAATVTALAYSMSGQEETAAALLRKVIDSLPRPLSPQHYYAAAAYAMLGEPDRALAELKASPPGWIRVHVDFLPHDPRFESLRSRPEFEELVLGHQEEIRRQRERYLARLAAHVGS